MQKSPGVGAFENSNITRCVINRVESIGEGFVTDLSHFPGAKPVFHESSKAPFMDSNRPASPLPSRYQFKSLLGEGGAGEVLSAWDSQLKRTVAVKRLNHATKPDEDVRDAWQEAMCLASIRHPNIVSIFDIGTENDMPYMVMEFVQGETLEQTVRRSPLSLPDFIEIARQCLQGIAAAHHSGLVHRDLKPANIMLVRLPTGHFQVKILDFGIAQYLQGAKGDNGPAETLVTGTVHWISPEQLEGGSADARSDLYSLGCVFYFALGGVPPFSGKTATEVLQAHLAGHAAPLANLRPDVPPALSAWVAAMMARNPNDRPMDAVAALTEFDTITASGHRTARHEAPAFSPTVLPNDATARIDLGFANLPPAPPPAKRRLPRWAWLAAIGLLLIAAMGLVAHLGTPKNERPAFRIHGSNTIGSKLAPALVEGFLAKQGHRNIHSIAETMSVERRIEYLDARSGLPSFVEIHAHGSRTAFSGLKEGRCDVAMSSSRIKESDAVELQTAGLGDLRSAGAEHIAALDGLAILVHPSNSCSQLNRKTVASIFEGKITDWSELGRTRPGKIHLHARDANSGTFDFFQSVVLESGTLSPASTRHEDSTELSRAVASDPDAIGFAALPYILDCKSLAIGDEGTPAQIPSRFTLATEDYALSRRLYFYAPANKAHPWTRDFLDFVASGEGQEIVNRSGFIKQTPVIQPGLIPANAPESYKQLLTGAERVGMNVRFSGDSGEPDSKARLDFGRLVELMSMPENRGRELVLVGFHEDTGQPEKDLSTSRRTAEAVASELEKRGLQVRHIEAFGSALPVASSADRAIREKNNRVEVWIRKPSGSQIESR